MEWMSEGIVGVKKERGGAAVGVWWCWQGFNVGVGALRGESKVAWAVPSSLKYARFLERTDALLRMTSGLRRLLELVALVTTLMW